MAVRKTKVPVYETESGVTPDNLPVTRLMLINVRTELLSRIEQSKSEVRADIHAVTTEVHAVKVEVHSVKAEVHAMKAEVHAMKADIHAMKVEVHAVKAEVHAMKADIHAMKADIHAMKADIHAMKADIHGVKADVARIGFLIEEQNVRNKVVLDALTAFMDRQTRVEQRLDDVEAVVRDLAASRPPATPSQG